MILRKHKLQQNKGVVLIVVLSILSVLTYLTVSLSRSASIDMKLTKHTLTKLKARYLAWAAVAYGLDEMRLDQADLESQHIDTLALCGIAPGTQTLKERFSEVQVGEEGFFSIGYQLDEEQKWGLFDQERFININALTAQNVRILVELLRELDVEEESASMIAYSVLDWKDLDNARHHVEYGAEERYYSDLSEPYKIKNLPYDSKEELMLVRDITPEMYAKVKDFITIFPQQGSLRVNFETAPRQVLIAMARSFSRDATNSSLSEAESLVNKLIEQRSGLDGMEGTEDDMVIDNSQLSLDSKESIIFQAMSTMRVKNSKYLTIRAKGMDNNKRTNTQLEVIVLKDDFSIAYWRGNP